MNRYLWPLCPIFCKLLSARSSGRCQVINEFFMSYLSCLWYAQYRPKYYPYFSRKTSSIMRGLEKFTVAKTWKVTEKAQVSILNVNIWRYEFRWKTQMWKFTQIRKDNRTMRMVQSCTYSCSWKIQWQIQYNRKYLMPLWSIYFCKPHCCFYTLCIT